MKTKETKKGVRNKRQVAIYKGSSSLRFYAFVMNFHGSCVISMASVSFPVLLQEFPVLLLEFPVLLQGFSVLLQGFLVLRLVFPVLLRGISVPRLGFPVLLLGFLVLMQEGIFLSDDGDPLPR